MSEYTVTLQLTEDLYQKAEQVAQASQRSVEQILVEWIRPPSYPFPVESTGQLAELPTDHLIEVARSQLPSDQQERLEFLLTQQRQHGLSDREYQEASRLVEQEDLLTLRKAQALYILKQRNALPDDLARLVS